MSSESLNTCDKYMRRELLAADAAREPGGRSDLRDQADVDAVLTMLYRVYALRLTRLAYVMLGDKPAAEDVVQDAFAGLYRRWGQLSDQRKATHCQRHPGSPRPTPPISADASPRPHRSRRWCRPGQVSVHRG